MAMLARMSNPQFAVTRLTGRKSLRTRWVGVDTLSLPRPWLVAPRETLGAQAARVYDAKRRVDHPAARRDGCARLTQARDFSRLAPWR
jgi:hypothetical protein